jgi:hypothetical protein
MFLNENLRRRCCGAMTGSHTGNASRPRLFGPALTASADKSAHGEKAVAVAARVQLGYAHQGQETARATAKAERA